MSHRASCIQDAIRKLIEVLKQHPDHQYIFATHSPTVISASDPATITMLRLQGFETKFQPINHEDTSQLHLYLADIGARLSDVFGADRILWVEGQTEEQCFPILLRKGVMMPLGGIAIVGIRQTGAWKDETPSGSLSCTGGSPERACSCPALAFILDPECRSEQAKKELEHLSGALAVFLPRRMYENYLLHPRAIAGVANGIENFRESGTPVTKEEVSTLLDLERAKPENYCAKAVASDWEANIHGADVLKRIFANLFVAQTQFDKVRHSVALTNWIIDNDSEKLLDLAKYVGRILAMSSKKALEAAE